MKYNDGYSFYGQLIGVLVFGGTAPRIPGDAGHSASFNYPVRYEIVEGSFSDLIEESPVAKSRIITACQNLKNEGIQAVICDCGLMSLYQDIIGSECKILFAGSSLIQIPLIWQIIGRSGTIGIITGHSKMLQNKHLLHSGYTEDMKVCIQGMEEEPHFTEIVLKGGHQLNPARMKMDVINAGHKLMNKAKDLRAVILECSNLATYSADLSDSLNIPVFDTISAANLIAYGVNPDRYILV